MTGLLLRVEAALLCIPAAVSLIYRETSFVSFLITIAITLALGMTIKVFCRPTSRVIYAKDGLIIVALAWIVLSAFGAIPFVVSGEIPSYIDAFFETVSGFTTTGSSIITDLSIMSHGMLFWRSFTHWIGGMGIIVLIMAIFPTDSGRSMHIMRAEMPGPIVGKLVPRVKDTAKILYLIYIFLTVAETVFLVSGDMNLFESLVHSLGTAGTGGFGIKPDSIGGYSSYSQWVVTAFMLIFGVNFNLYYLILIGRAKNVFKSEELRVYVGIVVGSIAAICVNIYHLYDGFAETLKHSAFQVASLITTTGYATADFDLWPSFSKSILFLLMFIGGCAGSTAGGLKVSRIVLAFKMTVNSLKKFVHPRYVDSVKFEGKSIDAATKKSLNSYIMIYFMLFAVLFLAVSIDNFDFETNVSAIAACYNNIGPGFAAVGPTLSYAAFSPFSKLVLSFAMLLGRLELYPILTMLLPIAWKRSRVREKIEVYEEE